MNDELTQELNAARNFFCKAWKKKCQQLPLEPLEVQITDIIQQHPEYHEFFNDSANTTIKNPSDFHANPFLHISLHLGLLEQLTLDQPKGVKDIYQQLIIKNKDAHKAEHIMMECLQEIMNTAWAKDGNPCPQQFIKKLQSYL